MGTTRREQEKGRGHKNLLYVLMLLIGRITWVFSVQWLQFPNQQSGQTTEHTLFLSLW